MLETNEKLDTWEVATMAVIMEVEVMEAVAVEKLVVEEEDIEAVTIIAAPLMWMR